MAEPQKKLFSYYMAQNMAQQSRQQMFFYRTNRFRFNTFNHVQLPKYLKLKYPLIFAFGLAVVWDYAFRWDSPPPAGH